MPDGWEAVVSSAYPSVPGTAPRGVPARARRRAAVDRRRRHARQGDDRGDDRVRPARDRARPGVADRRAGAAARLERRRSATGTSSSRPTSRTAPCSRCRPEIAVVTNVELDHHTEFASLAELEARVRRAGSRGAPHVVRDAPPYDGELAVPGEHNRLQRRRGARRARARRASRAARRRRRSRGSPGTGRRFEVHEPATCTVVDDYGHHPTEVAATIAAARERFPGARVRVLFQPHLYSRTRHLAHELAAALAAADDVTVTDVYPAREAPVAGRDRQARRRRAVATAACSPAWTPTRRAGRGAARRARAPRRRRAARRSAPATSTAPSACSVASFARDRGERRARALHDDRHRRARALVRAARRRSTSSQELLRWARERRASRSR